MLSNILLQYGEYVYAAVVVAALAYTLLRLRARSKSKQAIAQEPLEPLLVSKAKSDSTSADQVVWWNKEDFPYSAPWWFRYPVSIGVFGGSYWAFFEWDDKAGWIFGVLLAIIGLGLVRELFLSALVAALAGLALWAVGAAAAALPVSVAIIIGAMIIAQAVRR